MEDAKASCEEFLAQGTETEPPEQGHDMLAQTMAQE